MTGSNNTRGAITLMASVDEYLQEMKHYRHSNDQRQAMAAVNELMLAAERAEMVLCAITPKSKYAGSPLEALRSAIAKTTRRTT